MRIAKWKDLEIHPHADMVPRMLPRKYQELKLSIGQRGQYEPVIVTREDPPRIIDGRHRYWACAELGLQPRFAKLPQGLDPLEFVLDKQGLRKELNKSQRALFGYRLSRHSTVGRPRKGDENWEDLPNIYSQEEAARRVGVTRKQLGLIKRVLESGSPVTEDLEEALSQGAITVNDALVLVNEPDEVQTRAMAMVQRGEVKSVARALTRIRSESETGGSDGTCVSSGVARDVDDVVIIYSAVSDLHHAVNDSSVDVIITIPSTDPNQLASLWEVVDFAAHALTPTGIVAVIADPTVLGPAMEQLIQPGLLQFKAELVIVSDTPFSRKNQAGNMHRSVLVFGKEDSRMREGDSVLQLAALETGPSPGVRRLMEMSTALTLRRIAGPGMRVCDPAMLDRPHTALAAVTEGRPFIGASQDSGCVKRIRKAVGQHRERGGTAGTREADDTAGTAHHQGSLFIEDADQHPASRLHANAEEIEHRQDGENGETVG